jgi:polyisoprenoid-binding protein YceI
MNKMKQTLAIAAMMVAGTLIGQTTYQINTDESVVEWKGEKIVGNNHVGTLKFSEGSLGIKGDKITSGKFVVDMNTIQDGGGSTRLDGHLKSDDFFSVATYPTSELVITKVSNNKNGAAEVTASLTIKGKTETVTFPALVKMDGDNLLATAELTFDRSKFEVRYGSNSFFDNLGDKAIKNEIAISVRVKATKATM